MNRCARLVITAGALALAISPIVPFATPASAGGRVFVGVGVGFPFWGAFPYPYAYPYAYPYPYPAYSPPVVVQSQPQTYVQQEQGPAPYWYYCQASQAYYPYVNECPSGWMQVVPQPAPPGPGAPPR